DRLSLRHPLGDTGPREIRRRAKHDDRLAGLVSGRGLHLIASQVDSDAVEAAESDRVPIDGDLAAADTEEAAEIDHRGAWQAGAINDDIDDPTHVLVGGAANGATQDSLHVAVVQGDGRWVVETGLQGLPPAGGFRRGR